MKSFLLSAIEDTAEYGYDRLPGADDLYHSRPWLRMDERIKIARPFVVGAQPDAGPPASAAVWGLVVPDTAFWPFMRIDTVLSRLLDDRGVARTEATQQALHALMPNAYLGALRGGTTRIAVDPGLDAVTARGATGEVLDGVETMARDEGLGSVAIFYLPREEVLLREVLTARGYVRFGPALHVAVLQTTTFAGYLRGLSYNRRRSLANERNKLARAGLRIGVEVLTRELSEQMLPLEAQLYKKHGHQAHPTEMARTLHHDVIDQYGDAALVITARAGGVLRGYHAVIQTGETFYSREAGFDYAWQQRLPIYYEVVFYRTIELAEERGVRLIYYSYSADETKASRGCELLPRDTYVKALDTGVAAELDRMHARFERGDTT